MSHRKKKFIVPKNLLLLLPLIPILILSLILIEQRQVIRQEAAIVGCGDQGDQGNEQGVGKYCTKNGGQCAGTGSPYCSADLQAGIPSFCSKPCSVDSDCGTGAQCVGSGLQKACEPIVCKTLPTNNPTITAPTITPLPTVTPTLPPNTTAVSLKIFLHGMGNSGDNTNPNQNTLSNKSPLHASRNVELSFFNASNTLISTKTGWIIYNATNGSFDGIINLGSAFTPGDYLIKVKSNGYLRKQMPGIQKVLVSSVATLPNIQLITGDINADNALNSLDYNMLIECYSDLVSKFCTDIMKQGADLNDDGKVDQIDYNLFIREVGVQNGD